MNNLEKLTRHIILGNHPECKTSEEAIGIENEELQKNTIAYYSQMSWFPITIGRVMKAYINIEQKKYKVKSEKWNQDENRRDEDCPLYCTDGEIVSNFLRWIIDMKKGWKLSKDYEDQSKETILSLLKIFES